MEEEENDMNNLNYSDMFNDLNNSYNYNYDNIFGLFPENIYNNLINNVVNGNIMNEIYINGMSNINQNIINSQFNVVLPINEQNNMNNEINLKVATILENIDLDVFTHQYYDINIFERITNQYRNSHNYNYNENYLLKIIIENSFYELVQLHSERDAVRYLYTYFLNNELNTFPFSLDMENVKTLIENTLKNYIRDKILYDLMQNILNIPLEQEDVKLILNQEQFDNLRTSTYKDIEENIKSINKECFICLESFQEDNEIKLIPCNHCFHTECIKPWLMQQSCKCPNCRYEITEHIFV